MPTPEAIREMDGPQLAALAYDYGLAPEHVYHISSPIHRPMFAYSEKRRTQAGEYTTALPWAPYSELDQADAVFRKLRERGWNTLIGWEARMNDGTVTVWKTNTPTFQQRWHPLSADDTRSEATCILRCAVLAVASAQPIVENGA